MTHPASRTALILEPNLLVRQALRGLLMRQGFARVLQAEHVTEALTLMREQPVHVVLTPWQAPGMDGVPLLDALRTGNRGPAPALILLDAGLPQQAVVAAVKAGIAGRLPLPPEPSRLAGILREVALPAPQPA